MQAKELIAQKESNNDLVLIDIREQYEYDFQNIGAVHIPLGEVLQRLDEIPKSGLVVVHCQSGKRGESLVEVLHHLGYGHVQNLEGGLDSYMTALNGN